MIRPILNLGDERLTQACAPVTADDLPLLGKWLGDMRDTLAEAFARHFIATRSMGGLSAVQIGITKRVCLLWLRDGGYQFLLNPTVTGQGGPVTYRHENCYSILHLRVPVARHQWVMIRYQDEQLAWHDERFEGLPARLVMHEVDHTNGILCLDRMDDGDRALTTAEYDALTAGLSSAAPSANLPS